MSFAFLGFVDVHGALRGKAYDGDAFDAITQRGSVGCTDLLLAVDPLDQPITTLMDIGVRSGCGDLLILPVPETIRQLPWRAGARICLGDLAWRDGTPCELSARHVLKRALSQLSNVGLRAMAAFEYEVRLWAEKDGAPSFSAHSYSARGAESVAELADALQSVSEELRLGLTAVHTEGGPGLLEINTGPAPALQAADNAILLRHAVHEVARRHGARASFLAKSATDEEGSSGHLHVSLWDGERNAMRAETASSGNLVMLHAVGGLLRHMPAMSLLMNPNVNSYKRLVAGSFAPINASWGIENRSAAARIVAPLEEAARIENRRPGADANPYLALAATIGPIAAGLTQSVEPPPERVADAYEASNADCPPLPASLESAIAAFAADAGAREMLGREFSDYFLKTRLWELRAWQHAVTEWERERYRRIT